MSLIRTTSATIAVLLMAFAALSPAAPAARHAGSGKGGAGKARHAHRCKRGRTAIRVGKRRSCRKLRLRGAAARIAPGPVAALRSAEAAIARVRFHGRGAASGRRAVRTLLASRGMRNLALLARRLGSPRAVRRLAGGALISGSAISSPDSLDLPGGWKGTTKVDPGAEEGTITVRKGKQSSSLTIRIPRPQLEQCPDADGATAVRNGYTFALDASGVEIDGQDGKLGFIHYAVRERTESEGHTGADAHLHDFDIHGKAYQHVQVGFKDASGKVLETNPPALATMTLSARYSAPFKALDALDKAFEDGDDAAFKRAYTEIARQTIGPGTSGYISDGAWDAQGEKAFGQPVAWLLSDVSSTYKALRREERAHWLVDCLRLHAEAPTEELAAGSTSPLRLTIAPPKGAKVAPATITASADVGAVAPASAKGGAGPTRFDYTAPSAGWKHGTVTLRAVSKQGAGTTTLGFRAPHDTYSLRFGVAVDRQFLGGEAGTGAAAWRGSVSSLLIGDPSSGEPLQGATVEPFGWSTYSYVDNGEPMVCQAGGYGHVDSHGTGSVPGSFEVTSAWVVASEPASDEATIRFTSPLDSYVATFYPDATSCGTDSHESSFRFFDGVRGMLSIQPGVEVRRPSGAGLAAETYTIGGWRAGSGGVEARRNLTWTVGSGTDEPETVTISLEVLRQP